MRLITITENLAQILIAKGGSPQPLRVLTPEGMVALDEWVRLVAEEPRKQNLRLWVLSASHAARAVGTRDDVPVVMPVEMSKSGRAETLKMSRHLFFWQVEAG